MKKELLPYSINKLLKYAFEVTLDEDSVFYTDEIVENREMYEKWNKMSKWNRIKYVTMFSIGKYWIQKESQTDFYSINCLCDIYYNFLTGVFEHSYKKQNKTKDIFKCFAIVKKLRIRKKSEK